MNDLLQKYGPGEVDVIYTHNDAMALGVVAALETAGRLDEFKVVGIDGQNEAIQAIKDGKIVVTFTYDNAGKEACESAAEAARGRDHRPAVGPADQHDRRANVDRVDRQGLLSLRAGPAGTGPMPRARRLLRRALDATAHQPREAMTADARAARPPNADPTVLEMRGIDKSFPGVARAARGRPDRRRGRDPRPGRRERRRQVDPDQDPVGRLRARRGRDPRRRRAGRGRRTAGDDPAAASRSSTRSRRWRRT